MNEKIEKFVLPMNEGMSINPEDPRLPDPNRHRKQCLIKFYDHEGMEVKLDKKDKIFYTYHYLRSLIRKLEMSDEDFYIRFGFVFKCR